MPADCEREERKPQRWVHDNRSNAVINPRKGPQGQTFRKAFCIPQTRLLCIEYLCARKNKFSPTAAVFESTGSRNKNEFLGHIMARTENRPFFCFVALAVHQLIS